MMSWSAPAYRLRARESWIGWGAWQREPERVFVITSYPDNELNAASFLTLKRDYWSIENGLHQCLDGAVPEDRSRVRLRNNAWVRALFRRCAISVANQATTQGFHDMIRRNRGRMAFFTLFRTSSHYDSG